MDPMPENVQHPCGNGPPLPISLLKTFAFHQGNLGAGYPKPTRWLVFSKDSFALPSFCYEGPPSFDNQGFYLGPLPRAKGMGSIRSRQSQGPGSGYRLCYFLPGHPLLRLLRRVCPIPRRRMMRKSPKRCFRYANRRAPACWVVSGRRELATFQGVRETFMMEGAFARRADGLPIEGGRLVVATQQALREGS